MLARELACAALGWALAAILWTAAGDLPRSLLSDPFGADGMPRGLAVALSIVSTLIAVRAAIAWRATGGAGDGAIDWARAAREHAKAFGMVALGAAYIFLAPVLGYTATAFILLVAVALYFGTRLTATLVAVSLGGALFFWWIFAKMLSVSMPAGFWPRLLG